jgi:hypothetical protein
MHTACWCTQACPRESDAFARAGSAALDAETLPPTTRAVGAWIARECGVEYQTRSGLIALHRIGMEHRKPTAISRSLDPAKQAAFIKALEHPWRDRSRDRSDHHEGCAYGRCLEHHHAVDGGRGYVPAHAVDPRVERVVSGRTERHELDTLLPWNWKAAKSCGNPRHHVVSAFDPSPNIPAAAQPAPTSTPRRKSNPRSACLTR